MGNGELVGAGTSLVRGPTVDHPTCAKLGVFTICIGAKEYTAATPGSVQSPSPDLLSMVLILPWLSGRGVAGASDEAVVGSGAKAARQHPTVCCGNRTEQR